MIGEADKMQTKVDGFLRKTGMHFDTIGLRENCDEFVEEMRRGLAAEPSSLLMLPTYLRAEGQVPQNREIAVMDAGGTNFRVATVTFTADGPKIDRFNKFPMPGTQGRIGRDEFFDTIADRLLPVLDVGDTVGFCFSYPTEILPNCEGRLLYFSKEVHVDDVVGQLIGAGINEALAKRGLGPKTFILLNDTVATLLGGVASTMDKSYESHIGYILGTGTNTCYIEDCASIVKSPEAAAMGGRMIVNMETGNYNRIPQGEFDRALDASTDNPGRYKMEKMISGHYQGTLICLTVRAAAAEGLFSPAFRQRLERVQDFSMYAIDQFCFFPYGGGELAGLCDGDSDALTLFEIIDASFERAARLTAINLAAIHLRTGAGRNPTRPVCVTAEGTTFYKSKLFRGKLDHYVRVFLNDTLGVYCEFNRAENVTLIGTAVAGLLNG